jgi:hypothetical protein
MMTIVAPNVQKRKAVKPEKPGRRERSEGQASSPEIRKETPLPETQEER